MSKLDLLKEYKSYYNAGKNPEIVGPVRRI